MKKLFFILIFAFSLFFASDVLADEFFYPTINNASSTYTIATAQMEYWFDTYASTSGQIYYDRDFWQGAYPSTNTSIWSSDGSNSSLALFAANQQTANLSTSTWAGYYWDEFKFVTMYPDTSNVIATWVAMFYFDGYTWTQVLGGEGTTSGVIEPSFLRTIFGDRIPFYYFFAVIDALTPYLATSTATTTLSDISMTIPEYTYTNTTTSINQQIFSTTTIPLVDMDFLYELLPDSYWNTIKSLLSASFVLLTLFGIYNQIKRIIFVL